MLSKRRTAARFLSPACGLAVWVLAGIGMWEQAVAQDPAQALEATLARVIEQSEPSVVSIARFKPPPPGTQAPHRFMQPELQSPPTDPEDPDYQANSYGAGIIISAPRASERFVLTNYHVVQGGPVYDPSAPPSYGRRRVRSDSEQLFIRFVDRRSCDAEIIAADPRSDLAVLRLDLKEAGIDEADLKPMDWSASMPVRKGQLVVMLGNPYSLAHDGSASASWGMIANLARRPLPWTEDQISRFMMYRLGNLIQIDGRLNVGTSGGPLLNLNGELIGLTSSLAAVEGYEKSAGFAIPLDDLTRRIVKSLLAGQEVDYGMLGVGPAYVNPKAFRELGTGLKQASAAKAVRVQKDGPADQAGILQDDIILAVNNVPIYSEYDLMRIVGLHAPEETIEILIWRPSRTRQPKPFTLPVKLAKWPVWEDERIIETSPRFPSWRGITVDYPTGRKKFTPGVDEPYRRAVVVTKVAQDSIAHSAGIQLGTFITEVNRVPVQTPGEFHEVTKGLRGPVELKLFDSGRVMIGE